MRMRTLFFTAMLLLLAPQNARPQSSDEQPAIPHAHYGRDGFWHCDEGYATGASGVCEPVTSASMGSVYGRLRRFENSAEAYNQETASANDGADATPK